VAEVTAKVLGIAKQTLENWVRLDSMGKLNGAGDEHARGNRISIGPGVVCVRCCSTAPWLCVSEPALRSAQGARL